MKILVVDNYDSFVYNLVQYLGQLGVECVVRHKRITGRLPRVRRASDRARAQVRGMPSRVVTS